MKIWYIEINNLAEGPYSIEELRRDHRITPDTRVWKDGFSQWKKIRDVPELKKIFFDIKDKPPKTKTTQEEFCRQLGDQLVLEMSGFPPFFWMLVILLTFVYITIHFYNQR